MLYSMYKETLPMNDQTKPIKGQEGETPLEEYIYLRIPSGAWDFLENTLEVDSRSSNFDRNLRLEIEEALAQVETLSDPLDTFRDFNKFLASLPRPENMWQHENRQAIHKIV